MKRKKELSIYSVPGIFGDEEYYDENGQQIGYSVPGLTE